MFTKRKKKK